MWNRPISSLFSHAFPKLLFLLFLPALLGSRVLGQNLTNLDASVSVFGQSTGTSSGNGITDTPSESIGALFTFRQSFKPWLGYEINYSYTRFSEFYSSQAFGVQNNVHEATGAYLVQGPRLLGFEPFGAAGAGLLMFLPTEVGGQHENQQPRIAFLYELGVNHPLLSKRFGARFQYRGLVYTAPDFKQPDFETNARRQTSELSLGLYLLF